MTMGWGVVAGLFGATDSWVTWFGWGKCPDWALGDLTPIAFARNCLS